MTCAPTATRTRDLPLRRRCRHFQMLASGIAYVNVFVVYEMLPSGVCSAFEAVSVATAGALHGPLCRGALTAFQLSRAACLMKRVVSSGLSASPLSRSMTPR
jgi:hypothetical protein